MRRILLAAIAGLVVLGAGAAFAAPALAHASLRESDPANGALLDTSPSEIRLSFTEPPDLSLTEIAIVNRSGAPVATGAPEPVAGTNRDVRVRVDALPDDVYTVSWRTVSATDGHFTSGAFTFGVGVSADQVVPIAQGRQEQTPTPTLLAVAARWSLYAGLAVLLGAAIGGLLAFGVRAVSRPVLLAPAWALAAAGTVVMTLEERRTVGVSLGTLLGSEAGGAFVRLAVAVGVVGAVVLAVCLRPGRPTLLLLAASVAATLVVRATGGHAGGSAPEVLLQSLHLAAVGAWIGGLVWLVTAIRRGAEGASLRRFSNIAATGLGVIVLTGFLRASNELGGWTWWLHLLDTSYGTTLAVKLVIVAILVGLGATNRFRNVRRYERDGGGPLLATVGGELVLAAGVLAMTALMTGLPPQGSRAAAQPAARPLVVTGSDFATTTRVRLQVTPGTVGPNDFRAEIEDYDTGEALDAQRVQLAFSLPDRPEVDTTLDLKRKAIGTWGATSTSLSLNGTWDVTVLVEGRSGSVEVPLVITPRAPEQRIEVSRAEGQPDIYTIHLAGGVSVQSYVDPGIPDRTNQVHVTVFDADGAELPLRDVALTITPTGGAVLQPDLLRLSPGHVVANVELPAGRTTFDISMTTRDGRTLVASFGQTIGG